MTMPPSGIKSEMDEEAVIEAEVQHQLELLDLENDDINNNLDDVREVLPQDIPEELSLNNDDEFVVEEAKDYFSRLQRQTEKFEKELTECDDLVNHYKPGDCAVTEDIDELVEAAQISGVDPQELKKKILEAIEREDESEDVIDRDVPENGEGSIHAECSVFVTSEMELLTDKQEVDQAEEPGEGVVALVDEIQRQELLFKQQLREMEMKYRQRENKWKQEAEMRRQEEEERENVENEKRKQILQQYTKEKEVLIQRNKIMQEKLDAEMEEKRKLIQDEVKRFEEQITLLETETRREQEELEKSVLDRQEKQRRREVMAATTLQAVFRGYRVRKTSKPVLLEKREERAKERELKRIEEIEKEIQEKKEAERKVEEEKRIEQEKQEEENRKIKEEKERLEEEKKRDEDERRKKEEKQLEEKRKKEEVNRLEERRKKEEEKRLDEERKKKEEKKLQEERRLEEERRKKEEKRLEEKRKNDEKKKEEERKKREEEKQLAEKKKEEERQEQETIIKENAEKERKKEERIKKAREEEERINIEKEKKVKEEREKELKREEERLEGERLKTENERLKEELKKIKELSNLSADSTVVTGKEISEIAEKDVKNEHTDGMRVDAKSKKSTSEMRKSVFESQQFGKACIDDTLGQTLPQQTEAKRLAWIKECLPWSKISNEPWKLKGGVSKKPPRRPSSAKKLPPLTENVIITAARAATLKQETPFRRDVPALAAESDFNESEVTTVQLSDLPGCTLTTLGQCWGLKSLKMTNCNLVALDGLQQCRQLQYLSVTGNKLEYIDLKDLGNLQVVDLSNNNLSVVHGLDGCTNIRWLDISCNRITRLGGLDPLRRLHTLLLSSNQLISCSSISDVPTLQHLDLSNNHLQVVEGLHKLCLLQRLNVSANNLLQFPDVHNQVLLEDCDLSDNSISSLEGITSYWLPMLTKLNLSKNSLNELDVLDSLILLRNLDVSNNQLLDLQSILSSLSHLKQLEELSVVENPATDETDYREKLLHLMPRLVQLDGVSVELRANDAAQTYTDFETMCRTHSHFHHSIRNHFLQDLQMVKSRHPVDDLAVCEVYFRYCDKSFKLAVEHRYAHEYGEVNVSIPVAPSTPKSGRPRSARAKIFHPEPEMYLSPKEMFEKALKSDSQTFDSVTAWSSSVTSNPKDLLEEVLKSDDSDPKDLFVKALKSGESHDGGGLPPQPDNPKNLFTKALELQTSEPRGRDVVEQTKPDFQAKTKQCSDLTSAAWPDTLSQTDINLRASLQNLLPEEMAILEGLHCSATKIQALWRGYILRVKLSAALDYARMEDEDDISELDDFNMEELNFSEESLEKGWRPTDTPQIPHSHPVLGKPPSGRQRGSDVLKLELAPVHPPNHPRHAWRNIDSPLSDLAPHPPRPPSSLISASDTQRSKLSKKEEKLAEEWGFHNSRTAELMLQRAKKMKLNSDRKRKLSKLDPKQRLALFRKLEEVTKLSPIRAPLRKTLPRKEYFQAREEEVHRKEYEKQQEARMRSTRTYEWLHTQVASLDTHDRYVERNGNFGSEGNLSTVNSEMTGTRRMQNFSGNDSDTHKVEWKARRYSSGENISGSGQTTYLPPIKTNSAGSSGSNGRQKPKEKMSWRNKPTEVDVGWGGGRKRQTNK